jgi:Flp pilus assembly pilin Flp
MTTKTGVKAMPPPSNGLFPARKETLMDLIINFSGDESGATAVEYALMLMGITLAIFVALTAFSASVRGLFELAEARFPGGK